LRRQADFDVAQALAIGELGEDQDAEMLGAVQRPDAMVAVVPVHNAMKSLPGQEVHDLGEQGLANIHRSLRRQKSRQTARCVAGRSSRRHPENIRMPRQTMTLEAWVRF
jgi:hypothetical protein